MDDSDRIHRLVWRYLAEIERAEGVDVGESPSPLRDVLIVKLEQAVERAESAGGGSESRTMMGKAGDRYALIRLGPRLALIVLAEEHVETTFFPALEGARVTVRETFNQQAGGPPFEVRIEHDRLPDGSVCIGLSEYDQSLVDAARASLSGLKKCS